MPAGGIQVHHANLLHSSEANGTDRPRSALQLWYRAADNVQVGGWTDFAGWAAQPGQRTVAGVLTEVLHRLFGPAGVAGLTVAGSVLGSGWAVELAGSDPEHPSGPPPPRASPDT